MLPWMCGGGNASVKELVKMWYRWVQVRLHRGLMVNIYLDFGKARPGVAI